MRKKSALYYYALEALKAKGTDALPRPIFPLNIVTVCDKLLAPCILSAQDLAPVAGRKVKISEVFVMSYAFGDSDDIDAALHQVGSYVW